MADEGKRQARAKSAVNLSIDSALLAEAKGLGINLSDSFEQQLRTLVRAAAGKKWLAENRAWIASYNEEVEKHGMWSDGKRLF
jgi:antitoxin CcdA